MPQQQPPAGSRRPQPSLEQLLAAYQTLGLPDLDWARRTAGDTAMSLQRRRGYLLAALDSWTLALHRDTGDELTDGQQARLTIEGDEHTIQAIADTATAMIDALDQQQHRIRAVKTAVPRLAADTDNPLADTAQQAAAGLAALLSAWRSAYLPGVLAATGEVDAEQVAAAQRHLAAAASRLDQLLHP